MEILVLATQILTTPLGMIAGFLTAIGLVVRFNEWREGDD